MKKMLLATFVAFFLGNIVFSQLMNGADKKEHKKTYVTVKTNQGKFTLWLYDDTPLHRDNFVRLCRSKAYKGVLFHRVIKDFLIQGGDPASKERKPDVMYGDGDGGFTVPAEILPHYYNKRGALIDAKEGDERNPLRNSAGTHFCVVQGRVFTDEQLDRTELRLNQVQKEWLFYKTLDQLKKENKDAASPKNAVQLTQLAKEMAQKQYEEQGRIVIPQEHRDVYKTIGGTPHLDGTVTIFGEIVSGQDVVEKITLMPTDANDRPVKDVVIKSTKVFYK